MKRKRAKQDGPKPTGLTSLKLTPQSCVKDQTPVQAKVPETDSVMEIYEPFLSDGFVSLNSDFLVFFIAGRPKAALLFWFFGDFRCGALLFMVIHVIYKYKNR